MTTLKDLFWKDFPNSIRVNSSKNRKGMIYAAKYYGIPTEAVYGKLQNELRKEGIANGTCPAHNLLSIGTEGTLIIVHVKEQSKLWDALKRLGYEESEAIA